MNEETKSKLKKYGKRAGIGLAFVSLFLLGVGVGACSARNAVGSSAEDNAPMMAQPYRVAPPLSTSDFPSLGDSEDNLLRNAYGGHKKFWWDSGLTTWLFVVDDAYDFFLLDDLPLGVYRIDAVSQYAGDGGHFGVLSSNYGERVLQYIDSDVEIGVPTSDIDSHYIDTQGESFSTYVTLTADKPYLFCDIYRYSSSVTITLMSAFDVPPVADVTLPTVFNPIWLYGDAYKGAVYGMLSNNAEGRSYTASLDVLFISDKTLYDGIYFEFDHLANTWYQEPSSGQIVLADRYANDYHYPVGMYYRRYGSSASVPSTTPNDFDCVWSPQWALTNDSDGNTHRYLTPTGAFASDAYRLIDVLEYSASTPVSARWPNLDALALLRLKASGFTITGDTNLYDAFDLLGGAFRSVGNILNIQILPYLTLGMLMFIPLIVLVLFAIIRILNK